MCKLISIIIMLTSVFLGHANAQETDPTRPLFGANNRVDAPEPQLVQLQSIVNNGQESTAVINGKLLKEGDRIEQYQLNKINQNSVVLSSPEKRLKLSLFSPIVAKSQ